MHRCLAVERPRTPTSPRTSSPAPKGNVKKSNPKTTAVATPIRNAKGKVISPATSTSNNATSLVLSKTIQKEPRCYVKKKTPTQSEMTLKVTRVEEKPGGSKITTVKEYTMKSPNKLSFSLDNSITF